MATTTKKDPVFVVVQLSGGNDFMNTVIPYTNPLYYDNRTFLNIPEEDVLPLDSTLGWHPEMGPFKELYDRGMVAIVQGIGYPDSNRSHFRGMDIWHTCEPDTLGTEGWLGKVIREIDPNKENVVTGVSFGPSMFRAMAVPGVPVATVDDLSNYGLLTGISEQLQRDRILERYKNLYSQSIGRGPVMEFLGQTGLDALKGADVLGEAPVNYSSTVEYADNPIAQKLKGIAQIHLADLGTRIFYSDHGSFDSHSNQVGMHGNLWNQVSVAVQDFFDDLKEHNASENVLMFIFSEFGRRTHDNGSGTDHGAAGVTFVIGDRVNGGEYGEYPSIKREDLQQGDLVPDTDFRGVYSTILEDWLHMDAKPIVGGTFEKLSFVDNS